MGIYNSSVGKFFFMLLKEVSYAPGCIYLIKINKTVILWYIQSWIHYSSLQYSWSFRSHYNLCNTTSSGTFLHMFWECPVVISLWTHVNLVLSSLLRIDWSVNPSLCRLNDDSDLCISSMQRRLLFAGFTAVKKTIIQNWFTPHMCREAYWIRSLLQIVSCECTTARVGGARPSTIEAWQSFLLNIRNYLKEWLLCSCCPSLSPSLLIEPWDVEYVSAVLFCFILDILLCCVWKNKK